MSGIHTVFEAKLKKINSKGKIVYSDNKLINLIYRILDRKGN